MSLLSYQPVVIFIRKISKVSYS
ncbi:hypothetical protein D046_3636A, partial [Vibrio parahaemolyticus V-223/04]